MNTKTHRRATAGTKAFGAPWLKRELKLLGQYSDSEVACRIGRSIYAVASKRQALGIPRLHGHARVWTRAELRWLGKVTDAELAARLGVSRGHVLKKRTKLGIVAFSSRHRPRWLGAPSS